MRLVHSRIRRKHTDHHALMVRHLHIQLLSAFSSCGRLPNETDPPTPAVFQPRALRNICSAATPAVQMTDRCNWPAKGGVRLRFNVSVRQPRANPRNTKTCGRFRPCGVCCYNREDGSPQLSFSLREPGRWRRKDAAVENLAQQGQGPSIESHVFIALRGPLS